MDAGFAKKPRSILNRQFCIRFAPPLALAPSPVQSAVGLSHKMLKERFGFQFRGIPQHRHHLVPNLIQWVRAGSPGALACSSATENHTQFTALLLHCVVSS